MSQEIFRSKNERVYDLLKAQIIRGELAPDEPLVIDALAAKIGVSAIPIREALRHLEANGFVVIAPYVGAKVAPLHADSIHEVFETLASLESVSARGLCRVIDDAQLDQLAEQVAAMAELIDDPEAWSAQNKQLHRTICTLSGMVLVEKMLSVALDHWDRLRCAYLEDVFAQRIGQSQLEHEQMLVALRRRDTELLETGISAHNRAALRSYIAHLERTGLLEASS